MNINRYVWAILIIFLVISCSGGGSKDGSTSFSTPPSPTPNPVFFISGEINFLSHSEITLTLNGTENITVVAENGNDLNFSFSTPLNNGDSYNVTLTSQPQTPALTCVLSSGSGTISDADITDLIITCPELKRIDVVPNSSSFPTLSSTPVSAIAVYDGYTPSITSFASWSSNNESIATVSSGSITGVNAGSTQIEAAFGGKVGSTSITVNSANLTSINLSPSNINASIGDNIQIQAIAFFDNGTSQIITSFSTFTIDDGLGGITDKAEINYNLTPGLFKALASGNGRIEASYNGETSSINFTVNIANIDSIEITPIINTAPVGTSRQFLATALYDDLSFRDVTEQAVWSTSDSSKMTENYLGTPGLIAYKAEGSGTVTALYNGKTASAAVSIIPPNITNLNISYSYSTLPIGQSQLLKAIATYSNGSSVNVTESAVWSSDDTFIATISNIANQKGTMAAISPGTVDIEVSFGGITEIANFTISSPTIDSVIILPENPMIPKSLKYELSALGTFSDASEHTISQQCSWSSSDESLGIVSNNPGERGFFTNISTSANIETITISVDCNGVTANSTITLNPSTLIGLKLSISDASMQPTDQFNIKAYGDFDDGGADDLTNIVMWSSTNSNYAFASNAKSHHGLVTAIDEGLATVSASLGGFSASAPITVSSIDPLEINEIGVGLRGYYYKITDWTNPATFTFQGSRLDGTIDFYWNTGIAPLGVGDKFYISWVGEIEIPTTGDYTFRTQSDDGARVKLDGSLIINNWTLHAPTFNSSAPQALTEGTKYQIEVELFEWTGQTVIELYWIPPGGSQEIVPSQYLFPD